MDATITIPVRVLTGLAGRGDLLCSCTRKPELLQPDESDPGSLLGACACGVWTVFEDESRPGSPPWTDVRAYELDIEPDAASTAA